MNTYIVNFIMSADTQTVHDRWKQVSTNFIQTPGIYSINLYEVIESGYNTPVNYQFVSIIEAGTIEHYQNAKNVTLSKSEISKLNNSEKSGLLIGEETVCQPHHIEGKLQLDTKNSLLINPFEISIDQIEPCLKMWHTACEFMVKQEGFVGVNFLKAIDIQSKFKFINMAEWQGKNDLISAHKDPKYKEHIQRAQEYKKHPSFCRHIDTIKSN